ncbi:MAG: hypothetical protein RRB13_02445 [bacterium]|nr:hypothetical protein [bacterium]
MEHLTDLLKEERRWLTLAVSHIILADGVAETIEKEYLKKLMRNIFLGDTKEVLPEIQALFRAKTLPPLEKIKVSDLDHLIYMLDIIAFSVFVNGKKPQTQTAKYFEAGKALGVNIGTLSFRLSLEAEKFRVERKLEQIKLDIKKDRMRTLQVD